VDIRIVLIKETSLSPSPFVRELFIDVDVEVEVEVVVEVGVAVAAVVGTELMPFVR
jgi:hypothetical protein